LDLELWRHAQRVRAALRLPIDRSASVVAEAEAWAKVTGNPRFLASVSTWRALQLTKETRPAEAARLHLAAAERTDRVAARMASQFNAGLAFIMCGRLDEARCAAEECRAVAASCRNPRFEALAETQLRSIRYRFAEAMSPDTELVDAVEGIGDRQLMGHLLLTEAAVAWRNGMLPEARDLAMRSWKLTQGPGDPIWSTIARALELVCGAAPDADEIPRLVGTATSGLDSDTAVQALGLLALAAPTRAAELRALAARRAADLRFAKAAPRGDVLSVREALEGLAARGGEFGV
jgi:hypothetical protein